MFLSLFVANVSQALDVGLLAAALPNIRADEVTGGALDPYFEPLQGGSPGRKGISWLKLKSAERFAPAGIPVLVVRASRRARVELFPAASGQSAAIPAVISLAAFRSTQDRVYALPGGLVPGQSMYVRVDATGGESREIRISTTTLSEVLERGVEHARMIDLTVGALSSMALAALLIWFVLAEKLFILYCTLIFLQAMYIAFLSGQGFDWPILSYAAPLSSLAWNVPVSLSGAAACLFAREIADLRHFSPRVYAAFGWFCAAFLAVTVANAAKFLGFEKPVNAVGNVIFFAAAVFTLITAFLSWRRGNRAAGWFLIAWALLEGFTIAVVLSFLTAASGESEALLYEGLPLSMVAAAVLIALGVADRLREQRTALGDAEQRAQTDPLTGVLNRRSLIERLDAACLRAQARGLPIALLFIDLDHFKQINDSYGHPAGDACLRAIIDPIHAELRQSDVIGRYGGEEFVVILSSASAATAHQIAERILERVANVQVAGFGPPIRLTCSIGVAGSDTLGVWGEELIARADAAVYAAKRSGRNQVHVAYAQVAQAAPA